MPGPYAFGSTTTEPLNIWGDQSQWGGFSSPSAQYNHALLAANPGYTGIGPLNPVSGQTIDPFTGLPLGPAKPGQSIPTTPPKPVVPAAGFTASPQPTTGSNPFGYIPGQLGLPNPAGDLQAQIPGLQGLNAQASNTIGSYLSGQIPLDVQKSIQDAAARFGVSSGMPGGGLARNRTLRDFGLTSLDLSNKGLAAYNPFVASVSQTQTLSPALQAQIAETNAINAAAPDPTQAASYAKELYDKYLATLSRGGLTQGARSSSIPRMPNFGPSGGTGAYSGGGPQGGYLPHVTGNQSYTPGAFDYASQFNGGYGNTPSTGVLQSDINPVGNFGTVPFDNTFGVPQDQSYQPQGTGDYYPNYVQDWFGGDNSFMGPAGGTTDFAPWFGGVPGGTSDYLQYLGQ